MDRKVALGARIKELREKNNMTQDILAEMVGIDPKHLSRIENGRNYPSFETLEKLVLSLKVSFKDIFQFDHLERRDVLIDKISLKINNLSDDKLKFVYKILIEI